jgi:hypothetical protein
MNSSGGSDTELVAEIKFPPEWIGVARFTLVEPIAEAEIDGGKALLVLAVLSDGTNLAAVTYPEGQALLRIAPMSNTVESRLSGVRPSADPKTDAIWGIAVGSMHGALAKTREEMGL